MSEPLKYDSTPERRGWTRRFIACDPGLSEAIEMYRESGFDVLLVNLPSDKTGNNCIRNQKGNECLKCFEGVQEKYRIIYTRPKH